MAETKRKGDLGQIAIACDLMQRGYKIAFPYGEDWNYDLIVLRKNNLERIQCKYTASDGSVLIVRCTSCNGWRVKKYKRAQIDFIAVYDKTTNRCFYFPSSLVAGRAYLMFRFGKVNKKLKQRSLLRYEKF